MLHDVTPSDLDLTTTVTRTARAQNILAAARGEPRKTHDLSQQAAEPGKEGSRSAIPADQRVGNENADIKDAAKLAMPTDMLY
jgi:hypothetical protein